jgi:outer membrane protein TolC
MKNLFNLVGGEGIFFIFAVAILNDRYDMKRFIQMAILVYAMQGVCAQPVTLEECRRKARANYPLAVRYDLVEKTKEYTLENASGGYLPQLSLTARATVQSDVTRLPVQIPGVDLKSLPKEQVQVMLELNQSLWDGGEIRHRRKQAEAASEVERRELDVEFYALDERVDQVYFGILALDERLKQNRLLQEDLQRSYRFVSACLDNGVAGPADLDAVKVEQLGARQQETELSAAREAYLQMLSLLTGEAIAHGAGLQKPALTEAEDGDIRRPELLRFEAQRQSLDVAESLLRVRNLPRLGLFLQGGYGNPGLNMLKNEFTPLYIAGVRLTWNFGGLYTLRNDRRLIGINRQRLQSSRELFLFNVRLQAIRDDSAIRSVRALMREDDEIIALRANIRKAAEAKVANGTLTVTEMLREITAESLARRTRAIHEVQLLMNIYQWKHTTNNE